MSELDLPCRVCSHVDTGCIESACKGCIVDVVHMEEVDRSGQRQQSHVARIDGVQLYVTSQRPITDSGKQSF